MHHFRAYYVLVSSFFCLMLISCCTMKPKRINNVPQTTYHSFVKIHTEVFAKKCSNKICERIQINAYAGSGAAVLIMKEGTLILTADHICNKLNKTEKLKDFTISFHMKILDYRGNSYNDLSLVKNDPKNDICLILVKDEFLSITPVSQQAPHPGERVYNLAAPLGIFKKGMVPTFEGFYSGDYSDDISLYTIPTQGGSSGSPIFNDRFQIIGLVHSKFGGIENIALSVSFHTLYEFLQNYQNRQSLSLIHI